jgi:hypothetical protein
LNETIFSDLDYARSVIARWIGNYNLRRPHSALAYLTPRPTPISPQRTIGCATPTNSDGASASAKTRRSKGSILDADEG